jgi:hypothetical protein
MRILLYPRIVEPANALTAGVDLVAAMLDVAGEAARRGRAHAPNAARDPRGW